MSGEKILVCDDEKDILNLLKEILKKEGFKVITAKDADELMENVKLKLPDLIILDWNLGGIDGLEACRILREDKKFVSIPIIMLTVRNNLSDKLKGFEKGADDYITKPFSSEELLVRVKSILQRKNIYQQKEEILSLKEVKINPEEMVVYLKDKPLNLTNKEYELFYYLLKNKNKVVSREKILQEIWGYEYFGTTRTVDVHIGKLRKKLGKSVQIQTIQPIGYKLID